MSLCAVPLRAVVPGASAALHITQPQSLLPDKGLLFLALDPWAGQPGVGLGLLDSQWGPMQPKYPFKTATQLLLGLPVPCLDLFYETQHGFLFISLVTGILFS